MHPLPEAPAVVLFQENCRGLPNEREVRITNQKGWRAVMPVRVFVSDIVPPTAVTTVLAKGVASRDDVFGGIESFRLFNLSTRLEYIAQKARHSGLGPAIRLRQSRPKVVLRLECLLDSRQEEEPMVLVKNGTTGEADEPRFFSVRRFSACPHLVFAGAKSEASSLKVPDRQQFWGG